MIYCFRLLLFFDSNVSQGSVATFVRCGGIFSYSVIANSLLSPLVKKIENQLAFGEVMYKSIEVTFFSGNGVYRLAMPNAKCNYCVVWYRWELMAKRHRNSERKGNYHTVMCDNWSTGVVQVVQELYKSQFASFSFFKL